MLNLNLALFYSGYLSRNNNQHTFVNKERGFRNSHFLKVGLKEAHCWKMNLFSLVYGIGMVNAS